MFTMHQCDGSIKVYGTTPWWAKIQIEGQRYRESSSKRIPKHEKITAAMRVINTIKRSIYTKPAVIEI